jgi:hypothetical protein
VRHFNTAAAHLLEDLAPGVEAAIAFEGVAAPEGWWVLGPRTQRELPVSVAGKDYEARCTAVAVPGMKDRVTVVRLRAAGA